MKTSRRQFLQRTSLLTAAALSAPLFTGCESMSGQRHGKRKLKKAIMYATIGYKGSVLEQFRAVKAAGFDGVEAMSHMNQDEVARAYAETGLKCASVCCATHWRKDSLLSSADPAVRAKGLDGLKQALYDAKRYGGTSVLLVPGTARDGVTYEQCWERSIGEIRKALPTCKETGVKIAVENVWNEFINKPEEAKRYIDEINSPMVGWHFDIGNMIKWGPSEDWVRVLGKRILKLHIKEFSNDPKKGFGVKFFEGDVHWPAVMQELDKIGYNGWAITEQPGGQTKDDASLQEFSALLDKVLAS
jgi:L-ribulose-5-phosphate 3-epimerase